MLCRIVSQCNCVRASRCLKAAISNVARPVASTDIQSRVTSHGLGIITLCREKQLKALEAVHMEQLRLQLLTWAEPSSGVEAVLLASNNERSFCSGVDVKAAQQAVLIQPYQDHPPPGHHINSLPS